jgi:hypothetical protein
MREKRLFQIFALLVLLLYPLGNVSANTGSIRQQAASGRGFDMQILQEIADSDPSVTTSVDPSSINVGQSATATVSLSDVPVEGYTGAEFTCPYDAGVVQVSNIAVTGLFGANPAVAINGPQNGSFIVAIAGSNSSKATTSGAAFAFTVTGLRAGQSAISCTVRVSRGDNVLTNLPSTGTNLIVGDPMIAAAGDIACDPSSTSFNGGNGTSNNCRQKAVSDLFVGKNFTAVLALGDTQYEDGALTKYQLSFDPSWGRSRSIIHPAVGNHEYLTAGASGYYDYFGNAAGDSTKGYYSYDVGVWHLIALNANCSEVGGCGADSAQEQWLQADLAAHPTMCTLAYWHQPRFSSGAHGNDTSYDAFWQDLYAAGVEIVLNGHDHDYERFSPQNPGGVADPNGIQEFVVGTGGQSHSAFINIKPNSVVRNSDTYGILQLTLHATSYDWQFVPEAGKTFTDSGIMNCHGAAIPASSTPSSTPVNSPIPTSLTPVDTATPTASFTPVPSETPTFTSTPVESPTPTFTSTPIPTSTSLPTSTLSGQVLAGKPVTVSLYGTGNILVTSLNTNPDGTFSLTAPAGTYTTIATASGFLRAQGSASLTTGSVTKPTVTLLAGDIDGNDVIDRFDALTIGMNYNATSPAAADLNNDGLINILDLEALAKNYGAIGPMVWEISYP